ncbi:hypothetical protein [Enterococcus sp. AZ196]|uniref:hypothetical protein n=1 Tax=Enterococcus sp. AZ196 TaxID=2774659 RepID=UPI003D2BF9B9
MKAELYDLYVSKITINEQEKGVLSPKGQQAIEGYDLVVLLIDHSDIDYGKIKEENKFFPDTKGLLSSEKNEDKERVDV